MILILFGGSTDRLIPLYAIGAFLAFTLSQAGMVVHWKKEPGEHKGRAWHMLVNGTGRGRDRDHHPRRPRRQVHVRGMGHRAADSHADPADVLGEEALHARAGRDAGAVRLNLANLQPPLVVIPMAGWDRISEKALRFGLLLSKEIKVVHVHSADEGHGIDADWNEKILAPIREDRLPDPELVTIPSTFRFVISPLMDYILQLESTNPGRKVAVLLPELVVRHWWENLLHNQRVQLLKLLLLVGVTNASWS